jgi:hypothetical protein
MTAYAIQQNDRTDTSREERNLLRVGTAFLLGGLLSQIPLGALHPHREYANDSLAAFHEYAHSHDWVLVHLGQFLGMLVITIGLVAISATLLRQRGATRVLGLVAAVTAVVAASVFAVQMAVDGVALKAAIDAWESAAGTDQAAAFQVADSVRSVEKGLSALFNITNGLTMLSLGVGLTCGQGRGRRLGWLAAVAGAGLLLVGTMTAHSGFSHAASSLALPTTGLLAAFGIGMFVTTRRRTYP